MGMYTSLVVSARLKSDTPDWVFQGLADLMAGGGSVQRILGPSAVQNPLRSNASFLPNSVLDVGPPCASEGERSIAIVSSIRNCHGEIEAFLDWLEPHIESGHGPREWWAIVTHEGNECEPTIHYLEDE